MAKYGLIVMHALAFAVSVLSFIYTRVAQGDDHHLQTNSTKPPTVFQLKTGNDVTFADYNILGWFAVQEACTVVLMGILLMRDFSSSKPDDQTLPAKSLMTQIITIVLQGFGSGLALVNVYLLASEGDLNAFQFVLLLSVVFSCEYVKHMLDVSRLDAKSNFLIAIVPTIAYVVAVIFTSAEMGMLPEDKMIGGVELLVAYFVIVQALKVLNEAWSALYSDDKGLCKIGMKFDKRMISAGLDILAKTAFPWLLILCRADEFENDIDGADLEMDSTISALYIVSAVFLAITLFVPGSVEQMQAAGDQKDYPASDLSEKERMLQVA